MDDQLHQSFDSIYKIIRELLTSFNDLKIEGIDFDKVEGLTNLSDALSAMEQEEISDILNNRNYSYEKKHFESHTQDNPERAGFWGVLKFWKPKKITRDVEVSDGEYIDAVSVYNAVIQALREDYKEKLEELEKSFVVLFEEKRGNCEAFLQKASEELDKELNLLNGLVNKVKDSNVDIENNKKCLQWMEHCSSTLSRIV